MQKSNLIMWDFDGCLVSSEHRYRLMPNEQRIDLDHWRANEHLAHLDSIIEKSADLFRKQLANPDNYIVIATARHWCAAAQTIIEKQGIVPHSLNSRQVGDCRGGSYLKLLHLRRLANLKQFDFKTAQIFEDNKDYLRDICAGLSGTISANIRGYYIPSNQGY